MYRKSSSRSAKASCSGVISTKLQQLVVGQQVPVAPDERDVAPRPLCSGGTTASAASPCDSAIAVTCSTEAAQDLGQLGRLDRIPVTPYELMNPVGKVAADKSRRGIPSRQNRFARGSEARPAENDNAHPHDLE